MRYYLQADRPKRTARMLGVGLDGRDRHIRITRGKNFDLLLGSEETHERMQEICTRVNEKLNQQGRRLDDVTADEFRDLVAGSGG